MGVEATAGTAVRLRVIKLRLPTGQIETLVTTLTEEEMPEEAFGEWYAQRWGIEVHDGQEQYALENGKFLRPPQRGSAQDDHATILFANLSAVVKQEAEPQGDVRRDPYQRKYERYRIHYRGGSPP